MMSATPRMHLACCFQLSIATAFLLSVAADATAQVSWAAPTSHYYLNGSSRRITYPSLPKCSYIRFGCGFYGANGSTQGTPAFTAVSRLTYTITGLHGVRITDHKGLVEFFEEEPEATYRIILNAQSVTLEYRHDPDDRNWRTNLSDTIAMKPKATESDKEEADDRDEDTKDADDESR